MVILKHNLSLIEKIVYRDYDEAQGTHINGYLNPTRRELKIAINAAKYGDLRGMLLRNDDLYVMDAEYSSHTDLMDRLGIEAQSEQLRVILMKDKIIAEYDSLNDSGECEPIDYVISLINKSERLKHLYPNGTNVHVVSWNDQWDKKIVKDIQL